MKVAQISTFRTECGVGKYCEEISGELSKLVELKVFAEILSPPQTETEPIKGSEDVNFERCWQRYHGYDNLQQKILEYKPDICHIQFVSGLFSSLDYDPNSQLQKFVKTLHQNGIKTVFTFHDVPEFFNNAPQLGQWYANLKSSFIVMNPSQVQGLKKWYPNADIHEIPLGTPIIDHVKNWSKKPIENTGEFWITQVGFYGIDKGMLGIIKAIPNIKIPKLRVIFAGGFHPLASPQHRPYVYECIKTAVKLGVQDKITFVNKLLSEDEIDKWTLQSNFLILNQQMVFGYSTSASAHRILTASLPIIMSNSPKLSEFENGKVCLKCDESQISETINNLYDDKVIMRPKLAKGAYNYGLSTTFDKIAKLHKEKIYETTLD